MCVVLHVNVGIFSAVDFILFYFILFFLGGGGGGGGYNDSGINITQPLPPLTSLLLLSMNPGRFEAKENSVWNFCSFSLSLRLIYPS